MRRRARHIAVLAVLLLRSSLLRAAATAGWVPTPLESLADTLHPFERCALAHNTTPYAADLEAVWARDPACLPRYVMPYTEVHRGRIAE